MSYAIPDYYGEVTEQFVDNIIKVNITSMTMVGKQFESLFLLCFDESYSLNGKFQLTRMVLPQMAEKRKGAIINLSSASAIQPTPLLTIYSATKVKVMVFFSLSNALFFRHLRFSSVKRCRLNTKTKTSRFRYIFVFVCFFLRAITVFTLFQWRQGWTVLAVCDAIFRGDQDERNSSI